MAHKQLTTLAALAGAGHDVVKSSRKTRGIYLLRRQIGIRSHAAAHGGIDEAYV